MVELPCGIVQFLRRSAHRSDDFRHRLPEIPHQCHGRRPPIFGHSRLFGLLLTAQLRGTHIDGPAGGHRRFGRIAPLFRLLRQFARLYHMAIQRQQHPAQPHGQIAKHGRLQHDGDGMDRHPPDIGLIREDPGRQKKVEDEVMHRRQCRGQYDRPPVVQQRQPGQRHEEEHMAVHLPAMAGQEVEADRRLYRGQRTHDQPRLQTFALAHHLDGREDVHDCGQKQRPAAMLHRQEQAAQTDRHGPPPIGEQ